jgi:hypothetical protein
VLTLVQVVCRIRGKSRFASAVVADFATVELAAVSVTFVGGE